MGRTLVFPSNFIFFRLPLRSKLPHLLCPSMQLGCSIPVHCSSSSSSLKFYRNFEIQINLRSKSGGQTNSRTASTLSTQLPHSHYPFESIPSSRNSLHFIKRFYHPSIPTNRTSNNVFKSKSVISQVEDIFKQHQQKVNSNNSGNNTSENKNKNNSNGPLPKKKLSKDQEKVLDLVLDGHNVFITGTRLYTPSIHHLHLLQLGNILYILE